MNKCLNVIFRTRSIILLSLDDFVLKICVTETLSHQSRIRLPVHKWPQTEHTR